MTKATKIDAPWTTETVERPGKVFPDAVDGSSSSWPERARNPGWKTIATAIAGISLGAGLTALVLESERQRRRIAHLDEEVTRLREDTEAVVSFMKVWVDQTDCGATTYLVLAEKADQEEEEGDPFISPEDDEPVPFEVTDKGLKALVDSMMEDQESKQ